MNEDLYKRIRATVKYIVTLLAQGRYEALETLTAGKRLRAEHLRAGVEDYGSELTLPPDNAFENLDIIQVQGVTPSQFSVCFDLYTVEEGKSDLSIELTLFEQPDQEGRLRAEIDGVHVL